MCSKFTWITTNRSESHSVMSDSLWPMDYTVHGILQARILEWVAAPFSRGSSQPRDQIQVSHIAGGFFTRWVTREAQILSLLLIFFKYQGNYNNKISLLNMKEKKHFLLEVTCIFTHLLLTPANYMTTSYLKEEREIQAYDPPGRRQRPVACLSSSHGQRGTSYNGRGCPILEGMSYNPLQGN